MIKKYMLLILGALLGGIVVIGVIIGIAVIILFPQLTIGNYYTTGKYIQGVNTEWIQGKTIEEISERYVIIGWGKISDGEYDEWITLQKTKKYVKYSYVPGETGFLGDVLVFLSDGKAKHAEKGSQTSPDARGANHMGVQNCCRLRLRAASSTDLSLGEDS